MSAISRWRDLLTPERVVSYPLVTTLVLFCVAAYDRLAGRGLVNGFGGGFGGDFLAFYTAGHFIARGTPEALYDPDAQHAFQRALVGAPLDGVALWVSPPYFGLLFVPLAALPYVLAFVAWTAASLAAVWFAFRVLRRELSLESAPARMLWIAIQYYPALQWLLNGQMTGLWLTVFTGVFVCLRRGEDVRSGLLLGCLACKPPLAVGLAVALLAARRFRALGAAALSGSAFVALGFLVFPASMRDYLARGDELVALVRATGYATAGLHGSFELSTLLLDGVSRELASAGGVVVTLALLGWIYALWARATWSPATRAWDLRFAATFALGLIASPHLFVYDLALLLLPLFVLTARFPAQRGLPLGGGSLLALVASVWALGLLGPALALLQQTVTRWLFGFSAALQPGVVAIAVAAACVARVAEGRLDLAAAAAKGTPVAPP